MTIEGDSVAGDGSAGCFADLESGQSDAVTVSVSVNFDTSTAASQGVILCSDGSSYYTCYLQQLSGGPILAIDDSNATVLASTPFVPTDSQESIVASINSGAISVRCGFQTLNYTDPSPKTGTSHGVKTGISTACRLSGFSVTQGTATLLQDNFVDSDGTLLTDHVPDVS